MRAKLDTATEDRVDMVLVGCPHLSFTEMQEIAEMIKGKKVKEGTDFWIMTNETHYHLACRCDVAKILEDAGVMIARDTCVMEMEEGRRWEGQNFVTNSGKVAQYAPGINRVNIKMASTKGCVEAAVTGRFPKEV